MPSMASYSCAIAVSTTLHSCSVLVSPLKWPAPWMLQVYSEMIGNLMMDALSAKKYYHFVRLMGRAASHITLECALQTHPQAAIICEEVHQSKRRLADIVHEVRGAHVLPGRSNERACRSCHHLQVCSAGQPQAHQRMCEVRVY